MFSLILTDNSDQFILEFLLQSSVYKGFTVVNIMYKWKLSMCSTRTMYGTTPIIVQHYLLYANSIKIVSAFLSTLFACYSYSQLTNNIAKRKSIMKIQITKKTWIQPKSLQYTHLFKTNLK